MALRNRSAMIVGAALLVVTSTSTAVVLLDASPGERARQLLRDPDRFSSTSKAVDTLIDVADLALVERDRCGTGKSSCDGWAALAAYAKVGAAVTLQCTAPGRERVRRDVGAFAEAVASAVSDGRDAPRPSVAPSCR